MSREIRLKQAYLREQNKLWPSAMTPVGKEEWPDATRLLRTGLTNPFSVFRSKNFLAQVYLPVNGATRISIQRTMIDDDGNWLQGMTWDDLMTIKSQIGFENEWAVEIFPPIDEVVNVANMRHLFVIPEAPEFAWRHS